VMKSHLNSLNNLGS